MPPPDPPPEGAIDTSVPGMTSPLGWGAFQTTAPAAPPPRDAISYIADTAIGMVQGAISIPAGLAGASTRIPEEVLPGMASRRETQTYLQDLSHAVGQYKSKAGRAEEEAGGPDITTDPMHTLTQGVAGIVPYVPVMMAGPAAPFIFGATSIGDVANRISEKIRFSDEKDLMQAPVYRETLQRTGSKEQAQEALYQATNDLASNMIAGGAGAAGGGLLTALAGKVGNRFLSKVIGDRIMHGWKGRLGFGAAEGFGAGALMTGGTEYGTQESLHQAGFGPPPDWREIGTGAAKSGLTLGAIGGAGKLTFGKRPAAPLNVDLEATAMAAQGYGPLGPKAGRPTPGAPMRAEDIGGVTPDVHRGPRGEYTGPEYGPEIEPRAPAAEMTGEDLGPGAGRLDVTRGPMTAEDIGAQEPPGVMTGADLGMETSEYGAGMDTRGVAPGVGAPAGRRPGVRNVRPTDIEQPGDPLMPTQYGEYGPEVTPVPPPTMTAGFRSRMALAEAKRRSRHREMGEADLYGEYGQPEEVPYGPRQRAAREMEPADIGLSEYGPEIPPRTPPSPTGGGFASRTARAEELRAMRRRQMQQGDILDELGPEIEPRGDVVQAGEEMVPGDIYEPGSREHGRAQANAMLDKLETLKRRRDYAGRMGRTREITRLDKQITDLRQRLTAHNRALRQGRPPPEAPEAQPRRRGPPDEPPPGGGGGPPEEPPPGGGPPERGPMEEGDLGLAPPGEVVGFRQPDFEPRFSHLDTTELASVLEGLRGEEQRHVDEFRRARDAGDVAGMRRHGDEAERHANIADALEDELNERRLHPGAFERQREELLERDRRSGETTRAEQDDDSLYGLSGRQVMEDLGITPHRAGRGGEERVLPEAANVPARPTLHARGTLTPGGRPGPRTVQARPVARAGREGVEELARSGRAVEVEGRKIGPKGKAAVEVARQRAAEAAEEGEPVNVRAARVPSMDARTEEARRHAAAKEARERREGEERKQRAVNDLLDKIAALEGERRGVYTKAKQFARSLVSRIKEITDFANDLVQADINVRTGVDEVPKVYPIVRDGQRLPLTREQQKALDDRKAVGERLSNLRERERSMDETRLTDRERKRRIRARHYFMRERAAERAILDPHPNTLSIEKLSELVSRLFKKAPGEEPIPRGARGARILREGLDPETMPLKDRMRLFESTVQELPIEDLRDIANQINNEALARIVAGQKGYLTLEANMEEVPQIRMDVFDQGHRGVGQWHRRFAAYNIMMKRINAIIGTPKVDERGRPMFDKDNNPIRTLGSLDTAVGIRRRGQRDSQADRAIRQLRQIIGDFYHDEMIIRAGGIREIDAADRAALQASKDQFRRAKEKTRGRPDIGKTELANIDEAMAEIDRIMVERWGDSDDERVGREIPTDEEGNALASPEQELSNIFEQIDRVANPQDYETPGDRKYARNFRSMLSKFNQSIDRVGIPDVLLSVRHALDILQPRGQRENAEGAEYIRQARIKHFENWLDEQHQRRAIDAERLLGEPTKTPAQLEQEVFGDRGREYHQAQADRFGVPFADWFKLPEEFKQLSLDFNTLITPKDLPETKVVNVGGKPDQMIPPRRQTTTTYPEAQLRLQTEERAAREQAILDRSPSMTLGDLYLPFQEQLEFIRRLQQGEGTEADLALRGEQLVAKATRLRDALLSIDPTLWRDPGREWAGANLQNLHNEMRARAGELPEYPRKDSEGNVEHVTPEAIHADMARWSMEMERIENEARLHYESLNPDVREMEYGISKVLDPAADMRAGDSLPRGAYVGKVSDYARTGLSQGVALRDQIQKSKLVAGNDRATTDALVKFVTEGASSLKPEELALLEKNVRGFVEHDVPARPGRLTSKVERTRNIEQRRLDDNKAFRATLADLQKVPEFSPYGIQTSNRFVRHLLNMADRIVGNLDVVHLTDEQMDMAVRERGLKEGTPSFYDRPTDRIVVRQSAMRTADRSRLLTHEIAHPIMEAAAQRPELQAVIKRLDEQRMALKDAFENPDHPQHEAVVRMLDGNDHGLQDIHEFFSELWSNDDFNRALHEVKVSDAQRRRWQTGTRQSLLGAVMADIKRGLTGILFTASKTRLLNDSSVAALDLMQRMEGITRGAPRVLEGEPLARAAAPSKRVEWLSLARRARSSLSAGKAIEVAVNPDMATIEKIARESDHKDVTVIRDPATGTIWAANRDDVIHGELLDALRMRGKGNDLEYRVLGLRDGRVWETDGPRFGKQGFDPDLMHLPEDRDRARLMTTRETNRWLEQDHGGIKWSRRLRGSDELNAIQERLVDLHTPSEYEANAAYDLHPATAADLKPVIDALQSRDRNATLNAAYTFLSKYGHVEATDDRTARIAIVNRELREMRNQIVGTRADTAKGTIDVLKDMMELDKALPPEQRRIQEADMAAMLQDVADNASQLGFRKAAMLFGPVINAKLSVISREGWHELKTRLKTPGGVGFYADDLHRIFMPGEVHLDTETLVHEAAHGVTSQAIDAYPAFKDTLHKIIDHITALPDYQRYLSAATDISDRFNREYAFTGANRAHEYIAEFWSNPALRTFLRGLKVPPHIQNRTVGAANMYRATVKLINRFINRLVGGKPEAPDFAQFTEQMIEDIVNVQKGMNIPSGGTGDLLFRARRVGGSEPGRPSEGFVRDVWEGVTERGKEIAAHVNANGGPTGLIVKAVNFADLARMGEASRTGAKVMRDYVQKIYDLANERVQRQKEIMEKEDHQHIRALADELRIKSPAHVEAVLDYMDRANYVGATGYDRPGEGTNKWVGDREEPGHRQVHNEWGDLNRMWDALPESSQKMVRGLENYYRGRYDAVRDATLRDLVHLRGFVKDNHAGATEAMMRLITDGRDELSTAEKDLLNQHVRGYDGYDKPKGARSADNNEFRDYLTSMRALPEFKKIAGVYYPMMRRGDYVVEAHAKLDRFAQPFGGVEQDRLAGESPTGHWLFPSKDAANQFVDRMAHDDAPFLKIQNAREVTDADGNVTGWQVDVNPLHLNFHASLRAAQMEHAALSRDPDMDVYSLQERRDHTGYAMNPVWATKVMSDMIEGTKRTTAYRNLDESTQDILSRQWKDLAVRHLMSTSARSRYLPRGYTSGASRNALDNLMQYASNTSHTLAEKQLAPQMRDAVAAMDKYETDMRGSKEPELEKWGLRRSQVKNEVHNRLRQTNDHLASPLWTKALQTVLKLSFLDKLMSPGFLLLNASEPWTIAAPMLAGEHGIKAYGEIAKAYSILGSGRVWAQGGADFAKVLKAGIHGDPQLADTIKLLSEKIKEIGFSDKWSTPEQLIEMFEYLQKHGYLDRNAGMELEQILNPTANIGSKFLNYLDNAFRQANVQVENVNRGVAGIAGYRLAKMKGKSHEEAMQAAQDIVDKSAGNYGYINAPGFFNHPHLKFAFQFKKYALRQTSNIIRVIAGAVRGEPTQMAQLVAMLASQQVISGALGMPTEPFKAMITATNQLGLNPYNTDDVERILNERLAGILGRQGKDAFLYGLPRLMGTGFGARTGWDTLWTYGTLGNKRDDMATAVGHLFGGAPGGMIAEWAQGGHDLSQGIASYMHGARTQGVDSMVNGARNLVPAKVIADAFPALHDYFSGRQKPSGQPFDFRPTVLDTIQRVGGIRTARDLAASQARGAFVRQRDQYNAERTRALQGYAGARTPQEKAAVRDWILKSWNTGRPEVQKITIGDMYKAQTAFENKAKLSPSDLGLAITTRTRPFAPNPNVYGFMPSGR